MRLKMFVKHKDKSYWVSNYPTSSVRPSVYVSCENKYGTEYERPIKKGSKTYKAVIAKAGESK